MRNLQFLLFLVTLPALAALGHDLYLFYENQPDPFKFCALGFIWTKYEPDSYRRVVAMLDKDTWSIVNYILTFQAFFVGLAFAAVFYIIAGVVILYQKAAITAALGRERKISLTARDNKQQFHYKKRGGR